MKKRIQDKLLVQRGKSQFKDQLKSYFVRCKAVTPKKKKKMRTIGVVVAAAGTAVISSPVALPSAIVAIGGYLIIGGAVATAVSQAAIPSMGNFDKSTD